MHEMAIAEGILDIALDYAQKNGAARIERIGLLLGELSGVETDALSLCFSSLTMPCSRGSASPSRDAVTTAAGSSTSVRRTTSAPIVAAEWKSSAAVRCAWII